MLHCSMTGPGRKTPAGRGNSQENDLYRMWLKGSCALALLGGLAMAPARADVFKCVEHGNTVYQDTPCPGKPAAKPYMKTPAGRGAGPAPAPAHAATQPDRGRGVADAAPAPGNRKARVARLAMRIRKDTEQWIADKRRFAAERRLLNRRTGALSPDEQIRQHQALREKWRPRLDALARDRGRAQKALQQLCPGGMMHAAHGTDCPQDEH